MEDILEILWKILLNILEHIFPPQFKEWLFAVPKVFRYIFVALFYIITFAIAMLIVMLIYQLYLMIVN